MSSRASFESLGVFAGVAERASKQPSSGPDKSFTCCPFIASGGLSRNSIAERKSPVSGTLYYASHRPLLQKLWGLATVPGEPPSCLHPDVFGPGRSTDEVLRGYNTADFVHTVSAGRRDSLM